MRIYRYTSEWFAHVIAAPDNAAAQAFVTKTIRRGVGGIVPVVEVVAPCPLTARAADEAALPTEIDTTPLFWVPTGTTDRAVDHDAVEALTTDQRDYIAEVSPIHAAWIEALMGPVIYAAKVACGNGGTNPIHARALAAAFGIGPPPVWLAPVLPAVIAVDTEATLRGLCTWDGDLAALPMGELREILAKLSVAMRADDASLARAASITHGILDPSRFTKARQTWYVPRRRRSRMVLRALGWMPSE